MPSGRVHHRAWRRFRWLVPLFVLAFGFYTGEWLTAVAILPGYLLGSMVDPDMDMPRKLTRAKQSWRKIWILSWMVIWWNLYGHIAKVFLGGHRGCMTHLPFLGTILRLAWLLMPPILIGAMVMPSTTKALFTHIYTWNVLKGIFVGLSVSDLVHVTLDLAWR